MIIGTAGVFVRTVSARLGHLTLGTVDLERAVRFWAALFDGEVWRAQDGATAVVSAEGMSDLMLQRVGSVSPGKNAIHLDLSTADLQDEIPRLEVLGACEVARYAQWGAVWATMTEPGCTRGTGRISRIRGRQRRRTRP